VATLFSDNFNRADSDAPGGNWVELGLADYDILTNRIRSVADAGESNCLNTSSLGTANYECEARHVFASVGEPGLLGRASDASNFYLFQKSDTALVFKLWKKVAGTYTELGSYSENILDVVLKLSMNGSTIKAFVGGTERISVTDTSLTAEGDFGMYSYNAVAQLHEWDDYFVYDFAAAATGPPVGSLALLGVGR